MSVITRWAIYVCPDCGHTGTHAPACGAFPNEPVEHGNRVVVVPDAAYRGAVDLLQKAYDALNRAAYVGDPQGAEMCDSVMAQIRDLRGGQ